MRMSVSKIVHYIVRRLPVARISIATVLGLFVLTSSGARADTAPSGPFTLAAVRADSPPPLVASVDSAEWRRAHPVSLDWDFTFHRPATERTITYFLYDNKYVYIAFIAKQKSPVIATQHTNGIGDDLDDNASVQFWPSGPLGIRYKFTATALGTRYEESSENDNYAPQWNAVGHMTDDGFTIVMRIPLGIMRGDGRTQWRVQFQRLKRQTGELFMWATDPGATDDDQGQFAGYLPGMIGIAASTRTKMRLSLYELAAIASQTAGGSTSRMGADLAVPVTPTTSILATAHPDFSNVELDQQGIQPSEFRRVLEEVRPFFAQGAKYYNRFDQIGRTANIMLNTPNIPAPRVGSALEGHQGGADFATFNSVGHGSTDSAGALTWTTANKRFSVGYQRVAASQPDVYDLAQAGTIRYDNLRNFFLYAGYGADRGTNVTDPSLGNWREVGVSFYSPTSRLAMALRKIGDLYSPLDGIVDHPGIAGYASDARRRFDFGSTAWLRSVELTANLERYHDATGGLNQADGTAEISIVARNLFALRGSTGSHFLLAADGTGSFFNENEVRLGYNQESVAPAEIGYIFGRFGPGYLRTWNGSFGFRIGARGTLDFESDEARYNADSGGQFNQTLQRWGLTRQLGPNDSVSAGVRRVTGLPAPVGSGIQVLPGSNVSFAFHHRAKGYDFYAAYGNPNAQTTVPALTLKIVEYFGAEKGT